MLALDAAWRLGTGWNAIKGLDFYQVYVLRKEASGLRMVLELDGDSAISFRVYSGARKAVLHAGGTLWRAGGETVSDTDSLLREIRKRCGNEISGADFYAALRQSGNEYGPSFQGVERVWTGQSEALARIVAPAGIAADRTFHPAVLDACVQALSACRESGGCAYYLKSIDKVRVLGEPGLGCWSHAALTPGGADDPRATLGSVRVYSDTGSLVATLEGVRLEYLEGEDNGKIPLVVSATFTAEPLEESLLYWGSKVGSQYDVEFAPYNQVLQQLIDPKSSVSMNRQGANIVLTRLEDWVRYRNELKVLVDVAEKDKIFGEHLRYRLPGGQEIAHLLKYETDYVHTEIFVDDVYGQHGVSLADDACVVDIGANIGLFTMRMQQLCKNPTVYSFEPVPAAFECLKANVKLYCQNAHVFNCGISDADKTLPFTFYRHATVFSSYIASPDQDETAVRAVVQNMLRQGGRIDAGQVDGLADDLMEGRMESETVDVEVRSLSSVIDEQGINRIDLLKIDAEGAELDVLRGIDDAHWPLVQQVVIEVHDQQGALTRSVLDLLKGKGFQTFLKEEELLRGSGLYNVYARRGRIEGQRDRGTTEVSGETIEHAFRELVAALKAAAARNPAPFLVCMCEPSPKWASVKANTNLVARMGALLADGLAGVSNIHLITPDDIDRRYPRAAAYDEQGDQLGHVPFTRTAYASLGTLLVRRLYSITHAPAKVIVLDCDNTLWKGVVGEDGPMGIEVDAPSVALQKFMVKQNEAGKLICLCSKNNAADVDEVFEKRSDMILSKDHIVRATVNWLPKSQNIQALARELNLGLDSFVFIDDSPVECAEVQARCPEVLTLRLPGNRDEIPAFLEHVWAFDQLEVTQEDAQRAALYADNLEREKFRERASSLGAFIKSLDLTATIGAPSPESLPRAAQLTQRTNQFNFTTIRRSHAELSAVCASGELRCLVTHVKDRFGDYGLVGLQLYGVSPDAITLDTMLLSCRVLGRGVEHQMLSYLGGIAQDESVAEVHVFYEPSAKNAPALRFLEAVGEDYEEARKDHTLYRFPAAYLAELTYEPPESLDETPLASPRRRPSPTGVVDSQLISEIATDLRDPERVLEQIVKHRAHDRSADLGEYVAPTSELERRIAGIWKEILGIDQVGIHDNFFDVGGTSLKAVQVIAQTTRELGVELRAVAMFEKTTIHALAEMLSSSGGGESSLSDVKNSQERGARRRARRRMRTTGVSPT